MAEPLTQAPALVRFFDSFLQEANIKWLLAIGSLILLCSSVMLVANHWGSYPPFWQYLIMAGYTGFIYLASQWSYYRVALRKTGTGLMALSVLLQPALFFALGWMPVLDAGGALQYLLLLGLTAVFALLTGNRLLQHLLNGRQTTFLLSYMLLSASYAVVPMLPSPSTQVPWLLAVAWAAFVLGAVKINRYVFWLTEQRQAPRVFGFFPVALLGGLFLGLFAQHGLGLVAPEWLGLACILVALPVLLTADAAAQVFAQRSGGLLERRPWAVMIPVLVGLLLCIAGLLLAGVGLLPGHSPLAITPTAMLATAVFALVAQRTRQPALVWAALLVATVAYNFSPAYFLELGRQLLADGAAAVGESRLPLAFYGLSYLPLLLLLTVAAAYAERADAVLFATPLRRFAAVLTALLLLPAFAHVKALLPVAVALGGVFALQAWLLRRRWAVSAALLALVCAAAGAAPFTRLLLDWQVWWNSYPSWLLAAAAVLLLIDAPLRVRAERLPVTHPWLARLPQAVGLSLGLAVLLVPVYVVGLVFGQHQALFAAALGALLAAHCWRRADWWLSAFTLSFFYGALWVQLNSWQVAAVWQPLCMMLAAAVAMAGSLIWRLRDKAKAVISSRRYVNIGRPLRISAWVIGSVCVTVSLVNYTLPLWLAGALATACLLIVAKLDYRPQPLTFTVALALFTWQALALVVILCAPQGLLLDQLFGPRGVPALLPLALAAAVAGLLWQHGRMVASGWITAQRLGLTAVGVLALFARLGEPVMPLTDALLALATLLVWVAGELRAAIRFQDAARVWRAELLVAAGVAYFAAFGLVSFGGGWGASSLLGVAATAALISTLCAGRGQLAVMATPLRQTALLLPALAAALIVGRVWAGAGTGLLWLGGNGLVLPLVTGIYAWYGYRYRQRWAQLAALVVGNVGLLLLAQSLSLSDPQFYLIPVGGSVLLLRRLLRDQLPEAAQTPLAYLGSLIVLVSPLFNIITGSWLHIFSLMVLAVLVIVLAIGLRVRALIYTGSAFLAADLVAMVVRGGIDHPSLLWLAGLALGGLVILLAALAERHREELLQRLRLMSAALQNWQ